MPLLIPPSLSTISFSKTDIEYAISFAYNFNGDPIINTSIGGVNFVGSVYTFSALNLPQSPVNLPAFRSMQFSQTFINDASDTSPDFDGPLFISLPQSGQIMKFGCPVVSQNPNVGVTFPTELMVCGMVPIIANFPTKIQFGKSSKELISSVIRGVLTVTLSTKEYNPYIFGSIQR